MEAEGGLREGGLKRKKFELDSEEKVKSGDALVEFESAGRTSPAGIAFA